MAIHHYLRQVEYKNENDTIWSACNHTCVSTYFFISLPRSFNKLLFSNFIEYTFKYKLKHFKHSCIYMYNTSQPPLYKFFRHFIPTDNGSSRILSNFFRFENFCFGIFVCMAVAFWSPGVRLDILCLEFTYFFIYVV